jgi:ATP-binding cassette subfamily C protein CydC
MTFASLLTADMRHARGRLVLAAAAAGIAAAAAVLLLGVAGWFIAGAAVAGVGGAAAAFNYLLPAAGIRLFALLRTGCRYGDQVCGHAAALGVLARLRPALYRALAAGPDARHCSAGDTVARLIQDVDEFQLHLVRGSAWWGVVAAGITGGTVLLWAGTAPAAGALALLGATLAAAWRLARAQEALGRAVPRTHGGLKQTLAGLAGAAAELRAYGLDRWAAERLDLAQQPLLAAQARVTAAHGWFAWLLAASAGTAAMLGLALAGEASLPLAGLAALASGAMIEGAGGCVRLLQRRGSLCEAAARLDGLLASTESTRRRQFSGPPVIACADVRLAPGTVVGIEGPSGCGKTTLLEQLAGLRDAPPGLLRLGGAPVETLDVAALRRCFAVAPQDAALLSGSVRDNLLLGGPAASEAALWEALRDAGLAAHVRALRGGLDCWVGEAGASLSGGQRRRLSLARTYLREAPWLLLDEPTEGLDAVTEAQVVTHLAARLARRGQGALIVSHRRAPLAICTVRLALAPGAVLTPINATAPGTTESSGLQQEDQP